jgi:hypothetical protein
MIISRGSGRDPRNKLFRAHIQIVIEREGSWYFKGTWQPLEARFQTKQDAEEFGIAWAKEWIDQPPCPPLPPDILDEPPKPINKESN